jgi:transglutaminase-like putative cysteine protease
MRSSLTESRPASNTNYAYSLPVPGSPLPSSPAAPARRSFSLTPSEGWLPLILLAMAVYSVVYSVTTAITINDSGILWLTTAFGLLGGLLIAKSRYFPQPVLHVGACILGYWLAIFATSLLAYHVSVLEVLSAFRAVIGNGFSLSGSQESSMVFLFYLAFLCFFLGYFGSWLVYRAHLPWLVALVYVSIMVVNLNYIAKHDLTWLLIFLVGSLILLIARVQLANQLTQWKNEGLYTDKVWLRGLTSRFLRVAALFVLLILPFSWLLPVGNEPPAGVSFWNNLDNAWANLTHGNLPSLNNPGALFNPYDPPANFFGNQLTITGSVTLPNGPVLSYSSGSTSQGDYLEGFTFDTFDGHTWTAQAADSSESYGANSQLPPDNLSESYRSALTSITIIQPPEGTRHYIFAPAQPGSFTVPVTVFTDPTNSIISAWTQTSPLTPDEQYQVTSELPNVTSTELEAAHSFADDPESWTGDPNSRALQQYYLQRPKDLSAEVLATAKMWTQGADNMYSEVIDLQNHLSDATQFTYSITNAPIPANIDAVTWLLHTKRGYCTYYATAMTMMARLLGIPARIVNGFSQGHYDAQQKRWIVDGSDAHSWVQVYFPEIGWINFDPTPGFALNETGSPNSTPAPAKTTTPSTGHTTPTPQKGQAGSHSTPTTHQDGANSALGGSNSAGQNFFLVFSLLILLCSLVILAFAIVRYRANRTPLTPVASIYARLCRTAGLVGSPPQAWQTPYEYTYTLSRRFPQASTALRRLADLFVRERWAAPQQAPAGTEEREVQLIWPRLRNTLLRSPFTKNR